VKAFNTISWVDLRGKAYQAGTVLTRSIAGYDGAALATINELATDAGFEPITVGAVLGGEE